MATAAKTQTSDEEKFREAEDRKLLTINPILVMFGLIECKVDSCELMSEGSLKFDCFSCASSKPMMYYNVIIPPTDIFDWMYCKALNSPAVIFRLKKEAIVRVKQLLKLENGFSDASISGSRYVILMLNRPLDEQKYEEFVDLLDANDVRLGVIDEYEVRYRLECAQQKRNFDSEILSTNSQRNRASEPFTVSKILETKFKILQNSEPLEKDQKDFKLFGDITSFSTEPKLVMFGTYECKLETIEILIYENFKFVDVPQNMGFERKPMGITIPFNEVQTLQFCVDQQIPSIFLKLRPESANVIRENLCLTEDSRNGYILNINSEVESEQLVKVVFKDYFAFQMAVNSMRLTSRVFKYLKIEEISTSKALHLLDSSDIVLLKRELLECNAKIAQLNSSPFANIGFQ
jgi:hypothetical protein